MSSYKTFIIPLSNKSITLKEALKVMHESSSAPSDIPWIVRLVENPKLDFPGIRVFNGAVDLYTHDCIHLILGRGMMPKDEAFVIGFTMGSTNSVFNFEMFLYRFVTEYLYPKPFKFTKDEHMIFDIAVNLGHVSNSTPLNEVDFKSMEELTLEEIRIKLGIEKNYLQHAYQLEQSMFATDEQCTRLLQ